jgi:hypothetical protein
MSGTVFTRFFILLSLVVLVPAIASTKGAVSDFAMPLSNPWESPNTGRARYIVQSTTSRIARDDVNRVGGSTRRSLEIIHAVEAELTTRQVAKIRRRGGVTR